MSMSRGGFAAILLLGSVIALSVAGFFFWFKPSVVNVLPGTGIASETAHPAKDAPAPSAAAAGTSTPSSQPLSDPPRLVRALYLTGWTAGSNSRLTNLIKFAKDNDLNAMVIDVKDYSGYVSYAMDVPEVKASGAEKEIRIADMNAVLRAVHAAGLYAIARISVFQDPILAKAHPDWALTRTDTGKVWFDNKGIAWMDPAEKKVWDYNASIARDALSRGFDEANFDYIRFPSDGHLAYIKYPTWDGQTPKHLVLRSFFKYLREQFPDKVLSADLFGLATSSADDLGIGQVIEDAYPYFDYVAPMVYPSHYAAGTLGYKNPALYPYEIVKFAMEQGLRRLRAMENNTSTEAIKPRAKLRPWIQVFDMGATYTPAMVAKQIRAAEAVLNQASTTAYYGGWLLWDPKNTYQAFRASALTAAE